MVSTARLLHVVPVLLLAALVAAPSTARQQESDPEEAQEESREVTEEGEVTEVIYVTARRREEPLQTTPVAVTAITPETLEDRNISDLEGITKVTPNLKLDAATYSSTSARVYVRGVGQDDPVVTADPGVGIYVDGVYLGRAQGSLQAISDIERIEVLRGPQGTLFGRNTIGGAVNIVTASPTNDFGGRALLRGGDYELAESRFTINLPASDALQFRLSTATADNEGFMTNAVTGDHRNNRNFLGGRLVTRIDPTDSFIADITLDYTEQDRESAIGECLYTGGGSLVPLANVVTNFQTNCNATAFDGDPYLGASDLPSLDESDSGGATLDLTWVGSTVTFQSISAYREAETNLNLDIDQSASTYFDQNARSDFDQVSQEFQLNGSGDSFQYTTGLYYFTEDVLSNDFTRTLAQFPSTPAIPAINALNTDLFRRVDNESIAAYGQSSFDFGDRFSLTVGARYTEEEKDIDFDSFFWLTDQQATDITQSLSFDEVTGLVSASYEFSDRVFGYVSASRGFKSGGFNGRSPVGSTMLETFEPEFVTAYEVGAKTTSAGGQLTLNAAAYWSDYEDLQLTIFQTTPTGGFASVVRNAGQATVSGGEVEFSAFTSNGFRFYGHLGLTDAEYDEFFADLDGDGVATDNSGLEFKHTPDYNFGIGLQYSTAIGDSNLLTIQTEYDGRGETFSNTANTPGTEITDYELLNARVAFDFLQGKLQLAAWGRNLTDETYTTTGLSFADSLGFNIIMYAPPRTYGADLRFRF